MRRVIVTGGLLLAILVAAGCGGKSDEDQVRSTVESFKDAALAGDDHAACDLMTDSLREGTFSFFGGSCKISDVPQASLDALQSGIENVAVTNDSATVRLENGKELELERSDGDWWISSV